MRRRPELALLVLLAACGHHEARPDVPWAGPPATPAPTETPLPLHFSSNGNGRFATLKEMKHRRTLYIVRATSFFADTAAGHDATGSGAFAHPHITFIDRSGEQTIADAPKAVITGADKSVLMTGGVHARSQDGNVLACDRLQYDGNSERIHGEGNVVMTNPQGLTLTGDVIDGDARLQDVRVYRK